jgi:hypothetical protein
MKKNNFMSNNNSLSYGLGVFLYINALFELKLDFFGFKISEFCIVGILLFVIIFIFNEINKVLLDNYKSKNIKYFYKTNFFTKFRNFNNINLERGFNKISPINIKNKEAYKVLLSLIQK